MTIGVVGVIDRVLCVIVAEVDFLYGSTLMSGSGKAFCKESFVGFVLICGAVVCSRPLSVFLSLGLEEGVGSCSLIVRESVRFGCTRSDMTCRGER